MSKLYKKYISLKVQDSSKMYLFECGIFYIFLDEDARIISEVLDLKLTNLNSCILKCGFPKQSADKYFKLLETLKYPIEIVSSNINNTSVKIDAYLTNKNINNIIQNFLEVNIDSLSIGQAFDLLYKLQNDLKNNL